MLITDSLPLLWLTYAALSVIVLIAGFYAISFLNRSTRWMITGMVAGLLWMPWLHVATVDTGVAQSYLVPAIFVVALNILTHSLTISVWAALVIGVCIGSFCGYQIGNNTSLTKSFQGLKQKITRLFNH